MCYSKKVEGVALVLWIALCLGKSVSAFASGKEAPSSNALSLEGAIHEALKRSPEVLQAQAAVDEKWWKRFETLGSGFLPKISVSGLHYFATQYTVTGINFGGGLLSFPGFYPNTSASLDVTVPIFNGLANVHQYQAASLMQDATQFELGVTEFRLAEEVKMAFYQSLAAKELDKVAELNVRTLEDHLREVHIQKQGGVATNYDNLRVEVQLNEARADAIDAQDNVDLSRKKLTQLLGLDHDERPLQGELPVPEATLVKNIELTNIPPERLDIRAMNMKAEAADHLNSAQSAWLVPQISLAGSYLLYDSQIYDGTQIINTETYQGAYNIGVFLRWNLFDGGVAIAQERQSAYQTIQAEKASQAAKLKIPYDFAYWKRRYLSNTDHYLSKRFDITRSEEAVRLAKAEQRAGTRTSSETLDAELDLFRARAGVVNAQVKAAEAQIRLELTLGRRL